MTDNIIRELDAWSENTPDAELRSLLNRAGDHIEFLETQAKVDSIDAVDYDDRKELLDLFQDTQPGTVTVEGPLSGGLYDKLLAVARWGARQAFERMVIDRRPDEPVSVAVVARSAGKASAMVDELLNRGRARGIEVSLAQPTPGAVGADGFVDDQGRVWIGCSPAPGSSPQPPSIADMAPGTTLWARFVDEDRDRFLVIVNEPEWPVLDPIAADQWQYSHVDLSTIRDVTPPPATPEEER